MPYIEWLGKKYFVRSSSKNKLSILCCGKKVTFPKSKTKVYKK